MKLTERLASLLRRPRSVSREDAAGIAGWVNEGGAFDPEGPPRVMDDLHPGGDTPGEEGDNG